MMEKLSTETLKQGLSMVKNSSLNDVVVVMPKFKIESGIQ
jgi:hypothetical protein